jgi:hypothetical protein
MADLIRLTRATTLARILERDDFSKRYAANDQITLTELLYPLMQAYDSVAIEADVELGGTDQLYNLLMGRQVMEYYGKRPQCVVTTPLLVGTDGKIKMSKSVGNYIGVTDPPGEMFGKVMSIPDHLMDDYYTLLLDRPMPEGEPVEQKRELARSLVSTFHGESAAAGACGPVARRGGDLDRRPDHTRRLREHERRGAPLSKGRGREGRREGRTRRKTLAFDKRARRPGAPGRQAPLRPSRSMKNPQKQV